MFRLLTAILAITAVPVVGQARAQPLDDVVIAAFDACLAMPSGAAISPAATRLGFSPSAVAPDRYVKTMGSRSVQIRLSSEPTSGGRTMRTCSVGIWGGLDDNARMTRVLMTRAKADGYRVPAAMRPAPRGGTEIMMGIGAGDAERGIQFSINDTIDPAKGAGTVLVHGWTE